MPSVFVTLIATKPRDAEVKQLINEHKTLASIDKQIDTWHETQPPATPSPVIVEHPVNPELQTGEAAKLGGPVSIHAPWRLD
jgi:hypothetical protein